MAEEATGVEKIDSLISFMTSNIGSNLSFAPYSPWFHKKLTSERRTLTHLMRTI
jgi:hypothetical protein